MAFCVSLPESCAIILKDSITKPALFIQTYTCVQHDGNNSSSVKY